MKLKIDGSYVNGTDIGHPDGKDICHACCWGRFPRGFIAGNTTGVTPWPWTVSELSSEIKGRCYSIKHGNKDVGWMVGHDDAEMAAKLPQIVLIAKRLLHTIDHLSPEQQALLQPHYIAALREIIQSMLSGEEKDNE